MKGISLFLSSFVALLLALASCCAWSENLDIVGTWKLISMTARDETTGKESNIYGENPLGFLTYTAGGRMSAVIAAADRKISADSAGRATPEEQTMLFRRSFAYAGSYTFTEDGVIHHVEVAADPTWIGGDQRRFARLQGNRLIILTPPHKGPVSPNPVVISAVFERIEGAV